MTKLTKEDKENIIVGGYLKRYEKKKICPECVEVYFDKEDLDWIAGNCKENKVQCDIEICEMHKLKKEQDKIQEDKHICDNDIPSEEGKK